MSSGKDMLIPLVKVALLSILVAATLLIIYLQVDISRRKKRQRTCQYCGHPERRIHHHKKTSEDFDWGDGHISSRLRQIPSFLVYILSDWEYLSETTSSCTNSGCGKFHKETVVKQAHFVTFSCWKRFGRFFFNHGDGAESEPVRHYKFLARNEGLLQSQGKGIKNSGRV